MTCPTGWRRCVACIRACSEAFYARLGWLKADSEEDCSQAVVLMKRVL